MDKCQKRLFSVNWGNIKIQLRRKSGVGLFCRRQGRSVSAWPLLPLVDGLSTVCLSPLSALLLPLASCAHGRSWWPVATAALPTPPPPAAECRPPSLGASPPQARPPQRLDEGQLSSTLCLPPKSWEDSESQVSLSDGRPQQGEPRDRLPVLSVMRSLGRVRPELA